MSFTEMTRPSVSRRRIAALAALALVAAVATALVVSTRADAQQALTTSISVSPPSVVNQAGTAHAMGVTVSPLQSGVQIRYLILSGPNDGETGAQDTNANGLVIFSYNGDEGVGTDAILIWADLDRDGVRDNAEPLTTAIVEWVGVAGTAIQLTPASSTGPFGVSHAVTATVTPAQSGVTVRFQVATGPNAGDAGIALTNGNGQATFVYTGDGGLGTDSISAWPDFDGDGARDGNEPQVNATRLWTSGSTGGVTMDPSSAARLVGEQHSVHATFSPAQDGLFMRFQVTSGPNAGGTGIALTNTSGRATYTYVGKGDGIDVITAWIDLDRDGRLDTSEPRGQATVSWGTASAARTVSATPTADTNPIGTFHSVTATVNPAAVGLVLRFRVVSGPHLGSNGRALTNSVGQAIYTYQGSLAGTDSIRVWVDFDDDGALDANEPRTFVSKLWTTGVTPQSITLQPHDNVALAGTTHTVTSTAGPAQGGLIVRFLVTVGPNRGDAGVSVTNNQGRASFSYLGNGGVGNDAIVSWLDLNNNGVRNTNEPQASAMQRWVSTQAAGIVAAPASSAGQVNTQHTVTATVSPAANGVLVRFRVIQGPNLGDTAAALTNSSGRASFTYLGNGGVGSDLVMVWADADGDGSIDANEPQTSVIRTWTEVAGSAFSLSPASDTNPLNTRHSMTATVAPAQSGLLVRFEVTAGPNDGTRGSDDTNSSGRADLSYVGDGGVGTDIVLAWVDFDRDGRIDAGEPQAIATKQWVTSSVAGLTLTPGVDQKEVGERHTVTAQLSPALSGVLVRFRVTSGPNEGETDRERTNSNGRASDSYRGDGGVGTDMIVAWADTDEDGVLDAGEQQATAVVTWRSDGGGDAASRAREICNHLDRYSHPSLSTLCGLVKSGQLSSHSEGVIIGVILKNAEKSTGSSRGHGRDHDDDDDDDDDD